MINSGIPVDRLGSGHRYNILQIISSGFAIYYTSLTLHFSHHSHESLKQTEIIGDRWMGDGVEKTLESNSTRVG
jgi:hypothetical protein